MNVLELQGCSPTPLAHYLKAVGILRLVSEQADRKARGFWRNEQFHLVTELTRQELETFFLESYSPTPFMSPWNKGAGFFKADPGIEALENSTAPRFAAFRQGIKEARALLADIAHADAVVRAIKAATKTDSSFQTEEQCFLLKESTRFKNYMAEQERELNETDASGVSANTRVKSQIEVLNHLVESNKKKPTREQAEKLKKQKAYDQLVKLADGDYKKLKDEQLLPSCRRIWRGRHSDWMRAAAVIAGDGSTQWPALFGAAGGNDGNLDFTNKAMHIVGELFDLKSEDGGATSFAQINLRSALNSEASSQMLSEAVGQFSPGTAGGANSGCGFGGRALVNPWDFLLMLEGAIAFSAGVARRTTTNELPKAAAPFAVYESAAGFASGVDGEKSRGEQWMPLWDRPLTYRELTSLLGEARCQLGNKPAKRPVEMARAIARLGVARGISSFERYGFIERNGQSNLATPLGRWSVPTSPPPHQELLGEIEGWVDQLRIKSGGKGAPASIGRAVRRCENAMMQCCRPGADTAAWRALLIQLGEAESQLVQSPGFTGGAGLQPLGAYKRLSLQWIAATATKSPEFRLALAIAAAHGTKEVQRKGSSEQNLVWDSADPIRRHFMPLESTVGWPPKKFDVKGERLASDTCVVCARKDLQRDASALLQRRLIFAQQDGSPYFPITGVPGTEASLSDILSLISGEVDQAEVLAIALPLMALDWADVEKNWEFVRAQIGTPPPAEDLRSADALGAYGMFRLCHHWQAVELGTTVEHTVRLQPAILNHLSRGNLSEATKLATQRLKISGLMPHISRVVGDQRFAKRLAMALVFPISANNLRSLAQRIVRPEIRSEPEPASSP